jgi:hypothetical protein
MKSNQVFDQAVKKILQPKLVSLGFDRIKIDENWIYPRFLYEYNDIWFGTSWDWRDNYLEIDLGRLFFFKDVLPRVIIIGPINIEESGIGNSKNFEGYEKYFRKMLTEVGESLEERVRAFAAEYPEAYKRRTKIDAEASKEEKQYRRQFVKHLGKQMKRADIPSG